MPPKQASKAGRGRPKGTANKKATRVEEPGSSNPFESSDEQLSEVEVASPPVDARMVDAESEPEKSIPKDLLTRVLHEFFVKDSTRLSRDANAAVGKYVDVFVREAIARAAVEKEAGFLEVSLEDKLEDM